MDYTERRWRSAGWPGANGTAVDFATFVFAHEGCAGEVVEARLDENNLATWCRGGGQARVFGPTR